LDPGKKIKIEENASDLGVALPIKEANLFKVM
jgi:hypothetical protein